MHFVIATVSLCVYTHIIVDCYNGNTHMALMLYVAISCSFATDAYMIIASFML